MTIAARLISLLESALTLVNIVEMTDDRYYLAQHTLPDDDTVFTVHYFDCKPVVLEFGNHRLNMIGEEF